ncbi:putative acetyltransferase [Acidobacteriia bacterium SbA2]|nr:putative acetyltransferase [Acidobacteriia bacterium SbA2]
MNSSQDDPCELLKWDSDFFELKIARLLGSILRPALADAADIWCRRHGVNCLYAKLRSDDPETGQVVLGHGYRLVDVRITLEQEIDRGLENHPDAPGSRSTWVVRPCQTRDLPALQRIARTRHRDTRFFFDGNFSPKRCEDLYERWITVSCQGYAQIVLVAQRDGDQAENAELDNDCIGYITCHLDGPEAPGRIGLFAVDATFTGQGVGRALVRSAMSWFALQKRTRVSVVTQGRNVGALRLYERCGFCTAGVELFYHKWYLDPDSPHRPRLLAPARKLATP